MVEYHYVECRFDECHYTGCRYAECRGANGQSTLKTLMCVCLFASVFIKLDNSLRSKETYFI
jgi:hypothetical protein